MSAVPELLAQAKTHHRAGQLQLAEPLYRQILDSDPAHGEAWYLLGALCQALGNLDEATACLRQAAQRTPEEAQVHNYLGAVLAQQGRLDEAIACFQQALGLIPDFADAQNNLQRAQARRGSVAAAMDDRPSRAGVPPSAESSNNQGISLAQEGKLEEAAACFQQALQIEPHHAGVQHNLGFALQRQGKLEEAAVCYRRAIELQPDFLDAHYSLAAVLHGQAKLEEAAASYRNTVRLKPDCVEACNNLGSLCVELGWFDEAAASFQQALRVRPDYAEAHLNLATLWLLQGDFARGWPEYAWRWKMRIAPRRNVAQPEWDGAPLDGRTILLHAEQGLGDAFQFIRYAPLVKARGGTVVVECRKPALPLLASCRGIDRLVEQGQPLPPFDCHAPLMNLPGIFQTSFENLPADVPYLFADAALVEHWRKVLAPLAGVKVGIAWQGTPIYRLDHVRSIPLAQFAPLAEIPGVTLISLQKVVGMEQLAAVADRFSVVDLGDKLDETTGPFMDTAAVMQNLDLVVTSDTATAHLAGALGVPVWVALSLVPSWRWLLSRADCPWYPTMRLFRQQRPGDWNGVFAAIRGALCDRFALPE